MKIYSSLVMIAICFFLSACGDRSTFRHSKELEIPFTEKEIVSLKSFQSFKCEPISGEQCPAGVGRIMVLNYKNKTKSKVCSTFMVSKNKILTNNHCISTPEECQRTIVSIYNGYQSLIASCKQILLTHADSPNPRFKTQDYTLIELDKDLDSSFFELAPEKASIGETLTVWAIDQLGYNSARLTELTCDYYKNSPSMELRQCQAIPGNSGSPVVNSANQIVGIIWGGTDNNKIDINTPLEKRRTLSEFSLAMDIELLKKEISGFISL